MTNSQANSIIGQVAKLTLGKMQVYVKVQDIRTAWGRLDALVIPVAGQGCTWVAIDSLEGLTFATLEPVAPTTPTESPEMIALRAQLAALQAAS